MEEMGLLWITKADWLNAFDVNLKVPASSGSPVPKRGITPLRLTVVPAVKPGPSWSLSPTPYPRPDYCYIFKVFIY